MVLTEPITEENVASIIWDLKKKIQTDRKIKGNKADVMVKDSNIPFNWYNISVKEFNKISKYKELEIEIEKMCHLKTITVPVKKEMTDLNKKSKEWHAFFCNDV